MKRNIAFLCLLIATLIYSKEIHATGSEFYNGLDACVEEGVQRQGSKWRSFYRPSARFTLFQQVTNLRFRTDRGMWKPEIPVHPQAIRLETIEKDGFPQTYLGAFVLSVFPSPDGSYLIPTQAVSDPLYELSLEKQALLFKEVKQYCDLLEPQKNYEWIEIAAPSVKIVNFQTFGHGSDGKDNPSCVIEMLLKYLPLFKQATCISLGVNQILATQYENEFCHILHGLKRLILLGINDFNLTVCDYGRIIGKLPKFLERITLSICSTGEGYRAKANKTIEEWCSILHTASQHLPLTNIMLCTQFTESEWNDMNERAQALQMSLTFANGMIVLSPLNRDD